MLNNPALIDQKTNTMEFRVIITKCEQPPTSASFDQLQDYLKSLKVPPRILASLVQGRPGILKSNLSYQEAITISDRLLDFGFNTLIDPPVEPKERVAPLKPAAQPKPKASPEPKTALAAGPELKPTSHTQPKMQSQPNKTGVKAVSQALAPAPTPTTTPVVKPAATRPTTKPVKHKPRKAPVMPIRTSVETIKRPPQLTETPPASGNSDADSVRGFFKPLSRTASFQVAQDKPSLKFRALAATSLLLPFVYYTLLLAIAVMPIVLWTTIISLDRFLFALAVLIAIPISLAALAITAALATPLFLSRQNSTDTIPINPKHEPKLFMLLAAIGKICGLEPPKRMELTAQPQLSVNLEGRWRQLWQKKPSTSILRMGLPNTHVMSLREFVATLAGQLSKLASEDRARSYQLVACSKQWLHDLCQKQQLLLERIKKRLVGSPWLERGAHAIVHALNTCYQKTKDWGEQAHHKIEHALAVNDPNTVPLQQLFTTANGCKQLSNLEFMIEQSYRDAITVIESTEANDYYPTSIGALCRHLLDSNHHPKTVLPSEMILTQIEFSSLLVYMSEYTQASTKQLYEQMGLTIATEDLRPVEQLLEAKEQQRNADQASHNYFSEWLQADQLWQLEPEQFKNIKTLQDAKQKLNDSIAQIRHFTPERAAMIQNLRTVQLQLSELLAAQKIATAKSPYPFQRNQDPGSRLGREIASKTARVTDLTTTLKQHNAAMGTRLALGLQLNKKQRKYALKLLQVLQAIGKASDKVQQLIQLSDELHLLNLNKPKIPSQQFQLHLRNGEKAVDDAIKSIAKRLRQCPYDFIDNRYPSLYTLLEKQFDRARDKQGDLSLEKKASITLGVLRQCYPKICRLAANIAVQTEVQLKAEKIKIVSVNIGPSKSATP